MQAVWSNEDISEVVEERLLRKTQPARIALEERFNERSGELADLGTMRGSQRRYRQGEWVGADRPKLVLTVDDGAKSRSIGLSDFGRGDTGFNGLHDAHLAAPFLQRQGDGSGDQRFADAGIGSCYEDTVVHKSKS